MWPQGVLLLGVSVNLGAMAMKRLLTTSQTSWTRTSPLDVSIISSTYFLGYCEEPYSSAKVIVCVFLAPQKGIYIYIYIIIMIINKYILYIYIFNPWKILFCNLRFLEIYNNIHQAVKKMEWNWKSKMRQNTDKNVWLKMCVCIWVWVYVWMRVFKLSQARNLKRWL